MGINGLWNIVKDSRRSISFLDLCIREMLQRKKSGARPFIVGVDFNNLFDKAAAGARNQSIHGSLGENPELQIFFNRLCEFLTVPAVFVFVYDGHNKPSVKRGKKVKRTPLWYLEHVKALLNAFGYRHHQAPGEAEAELARLNSEGLIDAIITDDSDSLVFGAKYVLRRVQKDDIDQYYAYDADTIHDMHHLTHDGLLLFALLSGGDYHAGITGCGEKTSLALSCCGFGEMLLHARRTLGNGCDFSGSLTNFRADIRKELQHNTHGYLDRHHSYSTIISQIDDQFPNCQILDLYAFPQTSWMQRSPNPGIDTSTWIHREPVISKITQFCIQRFRWPLKKILSKFQSKLWSGILISMLYSRYSVYSENEKKLLTPNVGTHIFVHPKVREDHSPLYAVTISTSGFVTSMGIKDVTHGVRLKVDVPESLLPPSCLPVVQQPKVSEKRPVLYSMRSLSPHGTPGSAISSVTPPRNLGYLGATCDDERPPPTPRNLGPDYFDLTCDDKRPAPRPCNLGYFDLTCDDKRPAPRPRNLGHFDLTCDDKRPAPRPRNLGYFDLTCDDENHAGSYLHDPGNSKLLPISRPLDNIGLFDPTIDQSNRPESAKGKREEGRLRASKGKMPEVVDLTKEEDDTMYD
ncbi:hypothetical protein H0H93_003676 [Arthromyces matolae]|nr:hypothetical protein H0H93_003676 [Arthromyces matolae]